MHTGKFESTVAVPTRVQTLGPGPHLLRQPLPEVPLQLAPVCRAAAASDSKNFWKECMHARRPSLEIATKLRRLQATSRRGAAPLSATAHPCGTAARHPC